MPNSFSIRFDSKEGNFWIAVDGKEMFQLSTECLEDSILARAPSTHTEFSCCRLDESERIISYGFCVEMCCPSTSATVKFSGDKVFWTDIRHPLSETDPTSFEFARDQHEAEINRVLIELIDWQNQELIRFYAKTHPPKEETPPT